MTEQAGDHKSQERVQVSITKVSASTGHEKTKNTPQFVSVNRTDQRTNGGSTVLTSACQNMIPFYITIGKGDI